MIGWFRKLFRRPRERTPDVSEFIARQRASRTNALQVQQESRQVAKILKNAHPLEADLMGRLEAQEKSNARHH